MVPVTLVGVYPVGPEQFLCALLEWEEERRYVPVWLPPVEGAALAARLDGWSPRRPDAHDVLGSVINQATSGVASIELSSYHQGTFIATLTLHDGTEIDMRPSDALLAASVLDVQLEADETVLQHAAMFLSAGDAQDYFGIESDDDLDADLRQALDGEEFAAFMRELGVGEDDDGDDNDDETDTKP